MAVKKRTYGLPVEASLKAIAAPKLDYRPRDPKRYRPNIALIGCGGISQTHLTAYKNAGYRVVALCDRSHEKAEQRRREFYPQAAVYSDYRQVIRRDDIEVIDVATHPKDRIPIVRDALTAGKHVLSQKPFVTDLDVGRRLVDLAETQNVKLAVNQNGRWAPHFSYMRQAIAHGLIGQPMAAHISIAWNHGWIKGTAFEDVRHIVLYDFAIHWFDIVTSFLAPRRPKRVSASYARSPSQSVRPNLLAQALVEYDDAQATLCFNADTRFGPEDQMLVIGTEGTIKSAGPSLSDQSVTLYNARGYASPKLHGTWFPDGFHGAMGELLCGIEEEREPENSAAGNLQSLALCFAAVASAETKRPQVPGKVKRVRV